ncbi:tRNA lysidine(34) synthetase TilS [Stigmatella sp. ncwal1]|uniref:tRNA(Ile)-lysidine synthase n=1 Tax=Stigmatella ashevillensis TaxID=2995309 RepID=A0ABT5D4L8_9BACT|nr:tRNA lysidine(34) synthetase TilS [Stigmatella ashevillena]MDC0708073.1 tRNA lysidine(34) synthetase TilS [Stigmatella ashevillena]
MPRSTRATALLCKTLEASFRSAGLLRGSVLLAVSGGVDSTALLLGTALVRERLGLTVEVATLDHGLRPEAMEEVRTVERLAALQKMICHVRPLHLKAGSGLEMRAREARYAALEEVCLERGLAAIATAHTASDQAETLLMRLARGASLRGATGILSTRGMLVRPLLELTREDMEHFMREQGMGFAVDPMNADPRYLRSRIRHTVLPALTQAVGYPVTERLASFARLAAEDDALLQSLAHAAWDRLTCDGGGLDAVGLRALELPLRRRVLARLLAEAGAVVDAATLGRVLEAVARGRATTLSQGLQLRASGGLVRCVRAAVARASMAALSLEGPGASGTWAETGWHFEVREREECPGSLVLRLSEETCWPLTVRLRRPGDRLRGKSGSRKLQDVFVDLRVPAERRDLLPVVVDARGEVLWVPGLWTAAALEKVVSRQSLWAAPPGSSRRGSASL